jgi:lipopolysaccharide export system protein LptA/lipopolysaccharide export system protein LptC
MRTQKAHRLARWSAAIAILMAAAVAGVYLHRAWLERRERASAPPPVPATVEEQSAGFSFSKVEGDRTIYTVRAANATQFKTGNRNLLEDVWITSYGQQGDRNDTLHTKSCEYISANSSAADSSSSPGSERMTCAGDVEIDLESASDAKTFPGAANGEPSSAAQVLRVSTSDLSFSQDSGVASTDRAVNFNFPGGAGKAVGLQFDSRQGDLTLARAVEIVLQPQGAPGGAAARPAAGPMTIRGQSMTYRHDDGAAHLHGPAEIDDGPSTLTAGEIALELDQNFHAQRAVASGQPQLHEADAQRQIAAAADKFTAIFRTDGSIGSVVADGNVRATSQGRNEQDEFDAAHAELELAQGSGQPQLLTASGGTKGTARAGATTRTFATDALQVNFGPPAGRNQSARPVLLHTLAPATAEWITPAAAQGSTQSAAPAATETTRMTGEALDLHFGANSQVDRLTGTGGVEVDQDAGAGGTRTSTSQNLDARFDGTGDWTTVEQTGRVHFRDAQGTADGDHAQFDHATNAAVLTGGVALTDADSRTTAQTATFAHDSGELRAEGRVITAELANGARPVANFSQQPARVSADQMVAERVSGQATYTGHARLWQGDAVMEADTIVLDHPAQMLTALGHVRAVFPAAAWTPAAAPVGAQPGAKPAAPAAKTAAPEPPDLWHAQGGRLTYWNQKSLGRLEENASADSQEASIRAPTIDFFFAPVDAGNPSGPKQLVSATAMGGVSVRQLDRRGTSQRADYTVANRKFVLSGGPPVLRDDSGNSTTGRQLTFIFADDTIVVDSEEGTRTLTLHRVEK